MLRSPSERRLWLAIRAASDADHIGQTLLLDQMHRDLFLSETRLETLSVLNGLVYKTPFRSGFHLILLQHHILDEILNLIQSDPDSVSSRYSIDMINGWRDNAPMTDWAQAQYPRISEPQREHGGQAGSSSSPSSSSLSSSLDSDADVMEIWFNKFQMDLLSALDYILLPDQDELIASLLDRIQACLEEIDYEEIVEILLAVHDMCQMILDLGISAVIQQDIEDIRAHILSLYLTRSGQICCRDGRPSVQTISSSQTGSNDIDPSDADQAELSAMFQSIATRDEVVEPEHDHLAGFSNDIDLIGLLQTDNYQINTSTI